MLPRNLDRALLRERSAAERRRTTPVNIAKNLQGRHQFIVGLTLRVPSWPRNEFSDGVSAARHNELGAETDFGDIGPLGNINANGISRPPITVVVAELIAETGALHSDDRIYSRIERVETIKDFQANCVPFEAIAASCERFIHDVFGKNRCWRRAFKNGALQRMRANCSTNCGLV